MLAWNYKPTCAYSIAVMLVFKRQRPLRRTLRRRGHFAPRDVDLRSATTKMPCALSRHSHLRSSILPCQRLAQVNSSIQSP